MSAATDHDFCSVCWKFVDMTPDIRGVESDEGKVVDGMLMCAKCADYAEECES